LGALREFPENNIEAHLRHQERRSSAVKQQMNDGQFAKLKNAQVDLKKYGVVPTLQFSRCLDCVLTAL